MVMAFADILPFNDNDVVYYTGATWPPIMGQFSYDDSSGPVDLTGAAVSISIVPIGTQAPAYYNQPAQILDAPNGVVQYILSRAFILPPTVRIATFQAQFVADYGNGRVLYADAFDITVLRGAGPAVV